MLPEIGLSKGGSKWKVEVQTTALAFMGWEKRYQNLIAYIFSVKYKSQATIFEYIKNQIFVFEISFIEYFFVLKILIEKLFWVVKE